MHIRNSFVIHTVGTQTPLKCETVLTHCRCDLICVAFTALQRVFFFFAKRVRQKDLVVFYFEVYSFLCLCARLLFFYWRKQALAFFIFVHRFRFRATKWRRNFSSKCVYQLQSIAQVASEKSYFFRLPINLVIRNTNSQPIVKMTAKEFMFGYESPLTTLGNQFLPDWIYFDKVGLIDRVSDNVVQNIKRTKTKLPIACWDVGQHDWLILIINILRFIRKDVRFCRWLRDILHGRNGSKDVRAVWHIFGIEKPQAMERRSLQQHSRCVRWHQIQEFRPTRRTTAVLPKEYVPTTKNGEFALYFSFT